MEVNAPSVRASTATAAADYSRCVEGHGHETDDVAGAVVALASASAPAALMTPIAGAAPTQYAADSFNRTVAKGWGTADVGGPWSLAGSASAFSVSGCAGRMVMPSAGSSFAGYLGDVSSSDTRSC